MHAKPGDRLRIFGREGVVRYATASSVRIEIGTGTLDVHHPCDGPHRVLLHLTTDTEDPDPDDLEETRRWAFRALRIPERESWQMHVSPPPVRCLQSVQGNVAAIPTPAHRVRGLVKGLVRRYGGREERKGENREADHAQLPAGHAQPERDSP
jgi:hypothetical protein